MSIKVAQRKIITEKINDFNVGALTGDIDEVIVRLIEYKNKTKKIYKSIKFDIDWDEDSSNYMIQMYGIRMESDMEYIQRTTKIDSEIKRFLIEKQKEYLDEQLHQMDTE
jgi:hypothetical protein